MTILSTDRTTSLLRGDSLKAIQTASVLGSPSFEFTPSDTYAGISCEPYPEASGCGFFGRTPKDAPEKRAVVVAGAGLSLFRNNVAAVLIASTAMVPGEPATALELPKVQQSTTAFEMQHMDYEVENFLEPLELSWDEDRFIVAEAIQRELAQFNANH